MYDLPALKHVMSGLHSGVISLSETVTETPSPFAENMLFGYVGAVMYQYDVPQAERSTQLLSMDPEVLERLLGATDMASLLDADVIAQVGKELAGRTFWNDLDETDIAGRVARYAKTHGPFTADQMIAELGLDAVQGVRMLDELHAKGELLKGHFVDDAAGADANGSDDSASERPSNGSTKTCFGVSARFRLPRHAKPSSRWNRPSIRRSCWTDKVSDLWVAPDMKASTG